MLGDTEFKRTRESTKMTLIVILNAALAIGIVGVIVALLSHAIVGEHRHHYGDAWLWARRTRPARRTASARPGAAVLPVEPRAHRRHPVTVLD
jgi:hypothetical protein